MMLKQAARCCLGDRIWRLLSKLKAALWGRMQDWICYVRNKTYHCTVHGQKIKIRVSNRLEMYRVKTYLIKEPETLEWIDNHLHPKDVLFDIGANIGLYSLYAAKACPEATIYGFEPEGQNFSRLCLNARENNVCNLIPCSTPLNSRSEFNYVYVNGCTVGSSLHHFGDRGDVPAHFSIDLTVRQGALGTSVDSLIAEYGLPIPNLIKIDVDGGEGKIVVGMVKMIANPAVRSILIEITDKESTPSPIHRQFADVGFKMVRTGAEFCYGEYRSRNFIFVR